VQAILDAAARRGRAAHRRDGHDDGLAHHP
jgi:hypothetical protein